MFCFNAKSTETRLQADNHVAPAPWIGRPVPLRGSSLSQEQGRKLQEKEMGRWKRKLTSFVSPALLLRGNHSESFKGSLWQRLTGSVFAVDPTTRDTALMRFASQRVA